jgi:hypothetical protein
MSILQPEVQINPKQLGIAMALPFHQMSIGSSVAISFGDKAMRQSVNRPVLEADFPDRG